MKDDTEEFIREITRHQSVLTAFIRSLLPNHIDPRDILQEVNITLWRKKSQYNKGTNFKAWSFTVAKFHVLNERKKLKRKQHLVFDDDILEDLSTGGPLSVGLLDDQLAALKQCVSKLRDKDRILLKMRYSSGTSIEQYAKAHKRKAATVRASLRLIRNALRACILNQIKKEA